MQSSPKQTITATEALQLLKSGVALSNMHISGKLLCSELFQDNFSLEFIADNCVFEHIHATCSQFAKQVRLTNCEIKKCEFNMTYFLGGLTIDNCVFDNYLNFECGGHNENGSLVSITNSNFKKFVNFFDCLYFSDVVIINNNFMDDTNILGKPDNLHVRFEAGARIENNKGKIDRDDEGDLESQSVYLR